jgi:RNA polymerase sigma-70 factor, ECF subfamily
LNTSRNIFGNKVTQWASDISARGDEAAAEAQSGPKAISFEDAALVESVRKGDMHAFGALVAKYQDRIYNMILRMCGRTADAEELAQETFLKALERIGQFRGNSQFYTWLFRIAANLTLSHRRRAGRIKFHPLDSGEDQPQTQADSLTAAMATRRESSPQAQAMNADASRKISQALDELDEEFRLVVVLREIEEMDYTRIADVLEVPVGTVKSRLHRARLILQDKLADLI